MSDTQFAFGCNYYDGVECPAMAAGLRPDNGGVASNIAERYDSEARAQLEEDEGTISEEMAESLWQRAVAGVERDLEVKRTLDEEKPEMDFSDKIEFHENMLELGERVQRALGWE